MDLTTFSWFWVAAAGALGACINALASAHAEFFPRLLRVSPDRRILRPGILFSAAVGAAASVGCAVAFAGLACASAPPPAAGAAVIVLIAAAACGLVAARCLTNGSDTRVLRAAVWSAASSPAAHPDSLYGFESAPADALYQAVDQLMPRRAVRR